MWIFLVAPKQRPTFPSNRNNLGRARALSRRSSRCCNASLELVYVAGVLREGGWPPVSYTHLTLPTKA